MPREILAEDALFFSIFLPLFFCGSGVRLSILRQSLKVDFYLYGTGR
ncbi:hypothetical protein [Sporolactobacillus putidus]|nr:hypothetical protein [Sporolactobacillus putidus]